MITHPAALLLLAACALALLSCSRPEPRPSLPDLEQTLAQLDAIPARVIAIREAGRECRFDITARCGYPDPIPVVSLKDLDVPKLARR